MEQPSCIYREPWAGRRRHCTGSGTVREPAGQGRKAYRKFIEDGQSLGHEERYYQAVDQRFLGDEKFIQRLVERVPQAEVRPGGRKVRFERLLSAVAEVHGGEAKDLVSSGRQRAWVKPRAQLAYLARAWSGMKAIEIARRLNRDASMVSRLCASYEAVR